MTIVLAGSLTGCTSRAETQRSAAFASEAPYLESDIPPANQPTPRAEVTSGQGFDTAKAQREFSAAAKRLRACPNVERVPVRIQVRTTDGRTDIGFVDGAQLHLTGDGRRCVLDAMSTIDVEDIASGGSPSNRPLGFTANVLLSWW